MLRAKLTLRIQNLREISWNYRIYVLRLWTKVEQWSSDSPGFNLLGHQCWNYIKLCNCINVTQARIHITADISQKPGINLPGESLKLRHLLICSINSLWSLFFCVRKGVSEGMVNGALSLDVAFSLLPTGSTQEDFTRNCCGKGGQGCKVQWGGKRWGSGHCRSCRWGLCGMGRSTT